MCTMECARGVSEARDGDGQPRTRRARLCAAVLLIFILSAANISAQVPHIRSTQSHIQLENLLTGMALVNDRLYVLENGSGEISSLSLSGDENAGQWKTIARGFHDPIDLEALGDGGWLVAERGSGTIYQYRSGAVQVMADGFNDIASISRDDRGGLYVVEMEPGRITYISPQGGRRTVIADGLYYPSDFLPYMGGGFISELVDATGLRGRVSYGRQRVGPFSFPMQMGPPGDWMNPADLIDPIRMAIDDNQPNTILVSVRHLEPRAGLNLQPGGVIRLDAHHGNASEIVLSNAFGPTDLIATRDGFYLMEEDAERISFNSWRGERRILWDGLGQPSAFARDDEHGGFLVAETRPETQLVRVSDSKLGESGQIPKRFKDETIGGLLIQDHVYASITSQGIVAEMKDDGEMNIITNRIFSPGKLVSGGRNRAWTLDRITGEIILFDLENGAILRSFGGLLRRFSDFDADENTSLNPIYALDRQGDVWRLNTTTQTIELAASIPSNAPDTLETDHPVIARVSRRGFVIALNDHDGRLVWLSDRGDYTTLASGYSHIVQINHETGDGITVLSQDGWLRTITLQFENDTTPTPTPPAATQTPAATFTPTPSPTPTILPAETPTPTITPTPTVETSVSNWRLYSE
ncbi:MAG: hypothetical protein GC154_17155 [bacterium]|nr:hypothetical protein [bacterium]